MSDTFIMPSALAHGLGVIAAGHPNGSFRVSADGPIIGVYQVEVTEDGQRDSEVTNYLVVLGDGKRADGTLGPIPTVVKR